MTAHVEPCGEDRISGLRVESTLLCVSQIDDAFRAEWRDLDQKVEAPNPYFCSWFLEPAMKYLAPRDAVRLCVLRRASDDLLIGLIPLIVGNTYAKIPLKHFKVWMHDHCYNGAPLIRRGFGKDVYGALIDWIDTHPDGARFLRFIEHPLTAPVERALNAACVLRSRPLLFQHRRERAVMTGGQDADDVFARAFNAKKRKELRRQARRMEGEGEMQAQHLVDANEIVQAVNAFVALEMSGWKGRREDAFPIGRSDQERAFFKEAMNAGARAGAIFCDQLYMNGAPAAMLFTLRCGNAQAAFKIAHDEKLNAYSPGVLLLIEATKRMLQDPNMRHFDSCARSGHPVADRLWRERMTVAQFNIPAAGVFDAPLLRLCAGLERAKKAISALHGNKAQEKI
jgi:CelD/BcsL family acetyltransferase involved in cellulose biosynthesis